MAKAKLKIAATEHKKFKVAAHFSDVEVKEAVKAGSNLIVTIGYKAPASLVECGRYMETVTGNELDETKKG